MMASRSTPISKRRLREPGIDSPNDESSEIRVSVV